MCPIFREKMVITAFFRDTSVKKVKAVRYSLDILTD